jgi:hypothetical protein
LNSIRRHTGELCRPTRCGACSAHGAFRPVNGRERGGSGLVRQCRGDCAPQQDRVRTAKPDKQALYFRSLERAEADVGEAAPRTQQRVVNVTHVGQVRSEQDLASLRADDTIGDRKKPVQV